MKRVVTMIASLAILSLATAGFAADGIKIASIDLRKIALESKVGVQAAESLDKKKDQLENNLKAKEAEFKKFLDATEAKSKTMSEKEKAAKKKEAQKKYEALKKSAENAQVELRAKEEEFTKRIQAGIEKVVKDYAVKNGYTMFIRKGDLIYTDGKNDIKDLTDDILKLYDDSQQEEGTKKQP
jgi:outer membrane protein